MFEVEVRSFVTQEKYHELLLFFKANAKFLGEDDQVTCYYDAPVDLRLQQNKSGTKLIVKKGKIHDEIKEEIEVPLGKEEFFRVHELLEVLGHKLKIKWLRKRLIFKWEDVSVCLDDTKGYGQILELEKTCGIEEKEKVLEVLKQKLSELGVAQTPKHDFDEKFAFYSLNWEKLIN